MQRRNFGPGRGFVLHKVPVPGCLGHFSAWYGSAGTLIDAEQLPGGIGSRPRKVKEGGPAWKVLAEIGKRQSAI